MGQIKITQDKLQSINLPISILQQGSQTVVYTPALDLCTSGDSRDQALANFHDAVQIFLEDLLQHGNLDDVLGELGWEKEESDWIPPAWECDQFQSVEVPPGLGVN